MGSPKVIYFKPEDERKNSWVRYILGRIKKNENFLCTVNGPTGIGKTYSALSIAEMISKVSGVEFGIKQVKFSFFEMMKLINSGDLKRGSIIVFDEPQRSIGAKDHNTETNKIFYHLASTFRHKNYIVFFCHPFLEDLDKPTRKLLHAQFQVIGKDETNKVTTVKPLFLEYNSKKDDFYYHFLRVVFKPKAKSKFLSTKLKRWEIPMPSKELVAAYEQRKTDFTTSLNKQIEQKLLKYEPAPETFEENKVNHVGQMVHAPTKIQLLTLLLVKKYKLKYNVAQMIGRHPTAVSEHLRLAFKKGFTPENCEEFAQKMGYTIENLAQSTGTNIVHPIYTVSTPRAIIKSEEPQSEKKSIDSSDNYDLEDAASTSPAS